MAISRSLMNRQLRASGGIMDVTPRENFGLGSSLKKFVRKIIPNEISEIAVKAAPFVAPFNPALAGVMSGVGTFDQTGSISAGLKSGAMNYGGGQLARYAGGAGFQGNPFTSGAFTPSGFTSGFSSPLGNQTGLGKFFSNRGTQGVQGVGSGGTEALASEVSYVPGGTEALASEVSYVPGGTEALASEVSYVPNNATSALVDASDMALVGDVKQAASQEFNLFKAAADKVKNFDYREAGNKALELSKKFGKAMFTNKDGSIDKAAVLGAVAFTASYAEAKALAADVGVEITPEEYDEATKAEKQEEYAGYLTNFFGGQKDGGRIGYEGGANELIMEKLTEDIMPDTSTEEYILIIGEDGMPIRVKKSDYESMSGMFRDTTTSLYGDAARGRPVPEFANGGRIGYKDGTIILAEDELAEMGGEQGLKLKLLAEKFMEDGMSESDAYAKAADSLYANGGRVNRRSGSPEEGEGSGLMEMLSVEVDAGGDDQEDMLMAYSDVIFNRREKGALFRSLGDPRMQQTTKSFKDLDNILKHPGMFPEDEFMLKEYLKLKGFKDGGRIGFALGTPEKDTTMFEELKGNLIYRPDDKPTMPEQMQMPTDDKMVGANRVSELLILRDSLLANGEDVSDIEAEIYQLTGKVFQSVGGISEIPTGQMRKNNAGVAERDYRQTGGFVPVGIKERADDVPAMLSKNEFVMTADSVRGIGNGSVEEGSKKLYNTMKQAEQKGKIA